MDLNPADSYLQDCDQQNLLPRSRRHRFNLGLGARLNLIATVVDWFCGPNLQSG